MDLDAESAGDYVEKITSLAGFSACVIDNLIHASSNWLDWRYWGRLWFFLLLDASLLIVSTIQGWNVELARIYLLLADSFALLAIVMALIISYKAKQERTNLKNEFRLADKDQDGTLDRNDLVKLMSAYEVGAFKPIRRQNFYAARRGKGLDNIACDFDSLALARHSPRIHVILVGLEFVADWLSFLSSLILFSSGTSNDQLAVAQGVISVFDITLVIHHAISTYLSKYKTRFGCITAVLTSVYCCSICGVFIVALCGFLITLAFGDVILSGTGNNTTSATDVVILKSVNSPGFWSGWALTLAVIVTFIHLGICYYCAYLCGCVKFIGRQNKKQLGRVIKQESSEDVVESVDDIVESDVPWLLGRIAKKVERLQKSKMITALEVAVHQ